MKATAMATAMVMVMVMVMAIVPLILPFFRHCCCCCCYSCYSYCSSCPLLLPLPPPATEQSIWYRPLEEGLAGLLVQLSARRLLPSAGAGRPSQYRGCLLPPDDTAYTAIVRVGALLAMSSNLGNKTTFPRVEHCLGRLVLRLAG